MVLQHERSTRKQKTWKHDVAHGPLYDKEHHGKKNVQISFSCLWGSYYGSCHDWDSCSCSLNSYSHHLTSPNSNKPQHLPTTFNHTPTLPPPFTPNHTHTNPHFSHNNLSTNPNYRSDYVAANISSEYFNIIIITTITTINTTRSNV